MGGGRTSSPCFQTNSRVGREASCVQSPNTRDIIPNTVSTPGSVNHATQTEQASSHSRVTRLTSLHPYSIPPTKMISNTAGFDVVFLLDS